MNEFGWRIAVAAITLTASSAAIARDEVEPPPPTAIDTQSPGGVNLSSGSFTDRILDLQIGGEGSEGLTFVRMYDSANGASYSTWAGFTGGPGWTHNWAQRVTDSKVPKVSEFEPRCEVNNGGFANHEICIQAYTFWFHSVVAGDASLRFQNIAYLFNSYPSQTGFKVGTYIPVEDDSVGSTLTFAGDEQTGNFTLIDKSGAIYTYHSLDGLTGMALDHVVYPDGTKVNLTYDGHRPTKIESSRGYAILLEYITGPDGYPTISAACAVNLAHENVGQGVACPSGVEKVQYDYSKIQLVQKRQFNSDLTFERSALTSTLNQANALTTYVYDDGGHVSCIIDPGQSDCRVRVNYSECVQDAAYGEGFSNALYVELHLTEKVLSQVYADGSRFDYNNNAAPQICPDQFDFGFPQSGVFSFTDSHGGMTSVELSFGLPVSITDPLGRTTEQARTSLLPANPTGHYVGSAGVVSRHNLPDGKRFEYSYDERGNKVLASRVTSDGASSLEYKAGYPATCTSPKSCNKPAWTEDATGQRTEFVYDAAHGGLLKTTLPADDNGVRPETRYSWVQQYAWIKNATGGFVQASSPVWVLASEEYCRTSSADANGNCAAGASDEVVTTYEYQQGSATKGSNVWLVGTAVTADGQTLRSCVSYDSYGRKVSETSPRGNLASCQ